MKTPKIFTVVLIVTLGLLSAPGFGQKKTEVVKPATCWFSTILGPEYIECSPTDFGIWLASGGWMTGHDAHGGKLITDLSTWTVNECFVVGPGQVRENLTGRNTAANGDYYLYEGYTIADVINGKMTGEVIIIGGVGKYFGVTGKVALSGTLNPGMDVTFTGEGYLSFPKK